jgi:hypothetical protein
MDVFDKSARSAAKFDPRGFFHWLLPRLDPSLTFHGWLDTRTPPFPGEPERACDTLAEFANTADPDRPWLLVVEFQTEPQADMLDRALEYLARLRRGMRHGPGQRGRYSVAVALVNLTGPVQASTLSMQLPGMAEAHLQLGVVLRTLREEDAVRTLAEIDAGRTARCILPWIPLMHGGGDSGIIHEWLRIAGNETESQRRSAYAALAVVFAELTASHVQWKQALEGWNMRESQIVSEWKAEGKVEATRTALLRLLKLRLRVEVPADIVATVDGMTDLHELSRWFDAAATAATLDDFRAAVRP